MVPPEPAGPVPVTVKLPLVLVSRMPFVGPLTAVPALTLRNDSVLVVAPVKLTAVPVVVVTPISAVVRPVAPVPVMPVLVPDEMSRPRTSEPVAMVTVPPTVGLTPPVAGNEALNGAGVMPLTALIEADAP